MKILFWVSIIIIIYVYIGYPLLIYLLSFFYKKPVKRTYPYPTVSILMSVYNEELHIEDKIKTLRELEYPESRIEILVGSDGSTDKTVEILKDIGTVPLETKRTNFGGGSPYLYCRNKREGKPNMLNLLAREAKGEILVFTDARQRLDNKAVDELVKNFADRRVGSVSAALFYENHNENKPGAGIGLYWEYEKFIRKAESRMGSMLGATGALYAVRKELFPELPADLILDDIYIPMKIVEKGYRAIFDKKAKVYDKVYQNPKGEFLRRVRTLAGNYQLFFYLGHLFNPLKGKISWQFFSHKFLRLVVPFLLILIFIANLFLLNKSFYNLIFILQITFYGFSFFGFALKYKNKIFDIPYMFCVMNSAAIVGLYRLLTHKQDVLWQKPYSTNMFPKIWREV